MDAGYKKRSIEAWNELAPRYHQRWAGRMCGPLQSTGNLIRDVGVRAGDRALDVACGTGMVTEALSRAVGSTGLVVGADTSITAIRIAKRGGGGGGAPNVIFVNADAEHLAFGSKFDIVTCQYALFFFPDAARALENMRQSLKKAGRIGVVVHGSIDRAPFYGAILDAAVRFIPDYVPAGTPRLDRYSTREELRAEVEKAGFTGTVIKEYVFTYSPGTFEEYWTDYQTYAARPIKEKIDALGSKKEEFRDRVRQNTMPYTDERSGIITFPWQVLVLTAMH